MKSSQSKGQILPLGVQPWQWLQVGDERLDSRHTEMDLEVLVNSKWNMSQQCALAAQRANRTLGCTRPSTASGRGEGLSPLLCAVWPHLQHWMPLG